MKRLFIPVVVSMVAGVLQCSLSPMEGGATDTDHPIPTTASILPLQEGNRWVFRYTMFDSSGKQMPFPDRDLKLEITGMYQLDDNRQLIPVSHHDGFDSSLQYVYRYEWESLDSGYLVSHRGTGPVDLRGLYVVGSFVDTHTVLFDTALLWYAYPAGELLAWDIDLPGGDTVASMMECFTKTGTAWMYRQNTEVPSPLLFLDSCYIYLQTAGDDTWYHCFHPAHGKVSMRHYHNGVLRESYVLVSEKLYP